MVSFLQGKVLGVQGDSISANFGNAWQNVVLARTGMTLGVQDVRSGRSFYLAFECYGTTTPGTIPGAFHIANLPGGCLSTAGTEGNTLAQNIANVDIQVIALGTNDQPIPLGALGDQTNTGTFYGNMRWVVETYQAAKPSLRIVLVTLQTNGYAPVATSQVYSSAMETYGNSVGVPVINMFKLGGVNAITAPALTLDGTHPNPFGFASFYGPVIAQGLQEVF